MSPSNMEVPVVCGIVVLVGLVGGYLGALVKRSLGNT